MISINLVDPRRNAFRANKDEQEISDIFYQHWEKMKLEVNNMVGDINAWRSARLHEINLYADEQVRLLARLYSVQRARFDKNRQENLETAKALSQSKMDDTFKELSEACKRLNFQVAQLDYARYLSRYPIILTDEDPQRERIQRQNSIQMDGIRGYRDRSTIDNANVGRQNFADSSRSYPETPSPADSLNGWFVVQSSQDSALQEVNNESNNSTNNSHELLGKCPICFMIFPSQMTKDNRQEHINEHLSDDDTN